MIGLIIFILVYIALDIYAFQSIERLNKSRKLRAIYIGLSILMMAVLFISFTGDRQAGTFAGVRIYVIGIFLAYMTLKIGLSIFMLSEDIYRFFVWLYRKIKSPDNKKTMPSRRKFVSQLALGVAAIPFASLIGGMIKGKYNYRVFKYTLHFDDLPDAFDGYQVTQFSDIHSGSFDNADKVQYGIDMINEQQSDAVFFTGDLVNTFASEFDDWKAKFGQIKAKDGVFSILGNHDYGDYHDWKTQEDKKQNFKNILKAHDDMGWQLLMNENTSIQRGEDQLRIIGVENWGNGGFKKNGDLDLATREMDPADFKILLSHDPSHWNEVVKEHFSNCQLTLSGHTHGMQFGIEIPGWFKWSPARFRYPQWAGIYDHARKKINVNRGFGYLAYPGRVGIMPEITVITLRKGKALKA